MNLILALLLQLLAICCSTSFCKEIEGIEIVFRVQNYQDVDGFRHLSELPSGRFSIGLYRVDGQQNVHIESKQTTITYDRTFFKLPKNVFDDLMKGKSRGHFTENNEFRVLAVAVAAAGEEQEKLVRELKFTLTFATNVVNVVYSIKNGDVQVIDYDEGPVRFIQFQILRSLQFVKMGCSHPSRKDWEVKFEKKEKQISFEAAVCPQDDYKISVKEIISAKKELPGQEVGTSGRGGSNNRKKINKSLKEFAFQCDEARFELPLLNLYKLTWNKRGKKFVCLLDMEKSGEIREQAANMSSHLNPRSSKHVADANVIDALLSLQNVQEPTDKHENAVQPIQKQDDNDDNKKYNTRRSLKTLEAGTSHTKAVVKSIAPEQEEVEKSRNESKLNYNKRFKIRKDGINWRIAGANEPNNIESSSPMEVKEVQNETGTTGDEHNLMETTETEQTQHEVQNRVGDVQPVQQHADMNMTLASSSRPNPKGKGIANRKGEKQRKKTNLKEGLKNLHNRLNKLDESPSPEIHGIGAGNSPEIAPLIEDVRNEVAEPAGDEHNGMEAVGNGREMVLAEGAENAPPEGNVGTENVYGHSQPMDVADFVNYPIAFSPSTLHLSSHGFVGGSMSGHPPPSNQHDSVHAYHDHLDDFWGTSTGGIYNADSDE